MNSSQQCRNLALHTLVPKHWNAGRLLKFKRTSLWRMEPVWEKTLKASANQQATSWTCCCCHFKRWCKALKCYIRMSYIIQGTHKGSGWCSPNLTFTGHTPPGTPSSSKPASLDVSWMCQKECNGHIWTLRWPPTTGVESMRCSDTESCLFTLHWQ